MISNNLTKLLWMFLNQMRDNEMMQKDNTHAMEGHSANVEQSTAAIEEQDSIIANKAKEV